ncbi:MAG: prepilin-type N-terminal cleavage/methylation domain-containing protein [Chitinivibrionales bacterium]|nr:prepilin-type N-terminal cleavage/methylation domain-containing protein [Chitinivibrionales bacterium]
MTKKSGFTLIELIVVIVIIGVLATVAVPKFMMAATKAKVSEVPTILMQIYTAEQAFETETSSYSTDADGSDIGLDLNSTAASCLSYATGTGQSNYFDYDIIANGTGFYGRATITVSPSADLTDADDGKPRIDHNGARDFSIANKDWDTYLPAWK